MAGPLSVSRDAVALMLAIFCIGIDMYVVAALISTMALDLGEPVAARTVRDRGCERRGVHRRVRTRVSRAPDQEGESDE